MALTKDDDINRPPDSSEDERGPGELSTQSLRRKRPLAQSDTNRRASKRSKRIEERQEEKGSQETLRPSASAEEPLWMSQPSQSSQRRKAKYGTGSKASYVVAKYSSPTPSPEKKVKHTNISGAFSSPEHSPATRRMKTLGQAQLELGQSSPIAPPSFDLLSRLENDDEINASNTSSSKEMNSKGDHVNRQRSISTSSLSSVDSFASLQLDKDKKEQLKGESSLKTNICPFCKTSASQAALRSLPSNASDLAKSKQRKFCYEHRIYDTKALCTKKGYPDLNLEQFHTSERLRKHVNSLVAVINRKKSSHYLKALDNAISEAKGNQSKINYYFNVTVLTTIHHGYYGPRGASIISNAINDDMGVMKALKKAAKSDKAFKTAGLGRAVDCVLLPEVLTNLVVDDVDFAAKKGSRQRKAEEEARKVLEESAGIGLILHPEDEDDFQDGARRDTAHI